MGTELKADAAAAKAEFRSFRRWSQTRAFADRTVVNQVERCVLHTRCLEMNLGNPSSVILASAIEDFAKLEAVLHT